MGADMTPDTPSIDVRPSGIHGLGAFAARRLERAETIGEYAGRRHHPDAEGDWNHELTYVFGLSDGSFIDGSEGGNATRHINHSCAPNCTAFEVEDADGGLRIVIEAARRIEPGEELFIDYALDVGDENPADYPCRCGARRCRGTLVAG
jgi:SET domain-containing protein